MNEQLGLVFEQRDRILEAVDQATDEQWREAALAAVQRTCEQQAEFISDDVWRNGLDSTREDRALGPIMLRAARAGWCKKTDRVRPSVRSHGSGKPVWKSKLFGGSR
jgi:hypothetical protein